MARRQKPQRQLTIAAGLGEGHPDHPPVGYLIEKPKRNARAYARATRELTRYATRKARRRRQPRSAPATTTAESVPLRYPDAAWLGDAVEYGPLPDAGFTTADVRIVWHTTETAAGATADPADAYAPPGYNDGKHAPHYTYNPISRRFYGHADIDARVGTMRGYAANGGYRCNEISLQVEIQAYSDESLAAGYPGRIAVSDLTADNFADLADLARWMRDARYPHLDPTIYYGPARDFGRFLYGTGAATRLDAADWYTAGGISTSHGAPPGQSHWDTGALDLGAIADHFETEPATTIPAGLHYVTLGDGTDTQHPELQTAVQFWQQALWRIGTLEVPINGIYDDRTAEAVKLAHDNPNNDGTRIDYLRAHWILRRWIQTEIALATPEHPPQPDTRTFPQFDNT